MCFIAVRDSWAVFIWDSLILRSFCVLQTENPWLWNLKMCMIWTSSLQVSLFQNSAVVEPPLNLGYGYYFILCQNSRLKILFSLSRVRYPTGLSKQLGLIWTSYSLSLAESDLMRFWFSIHEQFTTHIVMSYFPRAVFKLI